MAEQHPKYYAHFKKLTGAYRKIDKYDKNAPSLFVKSKRKKKVKKGKKKAAKNYDWLIKKLQDKDPFFTVDNGV